MYKLFLLMLIAFSSCRSSYIYVVRHAEKETATMSSDVPLSDAGSQRAQHLQQVLRDRNIQTIYSTNYIRTRSTVEPLARSLNLQVQTYQAMDTAFFRSLKSSNRNILLAGHSNTVDDIVNQIMGEKVIAGDLPETQYGDIFIIRNRNGKLKFSRSSF